MSIVDYICTSKKVGNVRVVFCEVVNKDSHIFICSYLLLVFDHLGLVHGKSFMTMLIKV